MEGVLDCRTLRIISTNQVLPGVWRGNLGIIEKLGPDAGREMVYGLALEHGDEDRCAR
jgi:hypothetical protein